MKNKENILVVDDDVMLLAQAEEILGDKYNVSLAGSGEKAVNFLSSGGDADIILMDVMMPGMNGIETLEKIREKSSSRDIPVIFLTSLRDTESELLCLNSGASDFISKPFDSRILIARIEKSLCTGYQLDEDKLACLPEPLTETQRKIAKLLARSYSNEEIGKELNYAIDTVKKNVSVILDKLQIKSRREIKNFLK